MLAQLFQLRRISVQHGDGVLRVTRGGAHVSRLRSTKPSPSAETPAAPLAAVGISGTLDVSLRPAKAFRKKMHAAVMDRRVHVPRHTANGDDARFRPASRTIPGISAARSACTAYPRDTCARDSDSSHRPRRPTLNFQ